MAVRRDVDLDVDPDLAWELLTSPDDLAAWLGAEVDLQVVPGATGRVVDEDGTVRTVEVDEVVHGERIVWHWWPEGAEGGAGAPSRVDITVHPSGDGTRVEVLEVPVSPAGARASVAGATGWRWSGRLLDLEIVALSVSPLVRV